MAQPRSGNTKEPDGWVNFNLPQPWQFQLAGDTPGLSRVRQTRLLHTVVPTVGVEQVGAPDQLVEAGPGTMLVAGHIAHDLGVPVTWRTDISGTATGRYLARRRIVEPTGAVYAGQAF